MNDMERMNKQRPDVILSVLKLTRALRRRPPHPQGGFPPAVERFLQVLFENDHTSSRELCELMDIRPSTMSEMIGRMQEQGMIIRESDANDRRVSRINLTEKGRGAAGQIYNSRLAESDRMSGCFTDEEAVTFCALCDRLSAYLESLPVEDFDCAPHGHRRPPRFEGPRDDFERESHGHHCPPHFEGPRDDFEHESHGHHRPPRFEGHGDDFEREPRGDHFPPRFDGYRDELERDMHGEDFSSRFGGFDDHPMSQPHDGPRRGHGGKGSHGPMGR